MNKKPTTFLGDMLRLMTGTTFAQVLAVIVSPILTRLYSPDAFGILAIFASIAGIFSVVSCLRYELAIVLPEKDDDALNLFVASVLLPFLVAFIVYLILLMFGDRLSNALKAPEIEAYYWIVALFVLISGILSANKYLNTRTKHFSRQALANISNSSVNASVSLGLGVTGHTNAPSLIFANVCGSAIAAAMLSVKNWRENKEVIKKSVNWEKIKYWLKRYRKFPIYDSWSGLMNSISAQLPSLLLAGFFSPAIAGFYALGNRVLNMPMSLLGSSIAQVYFQRSAVAKYSGDLPRITEVIFSRLLSLAICPLLVLMIIGPQAFSLVFGEGWVTAGTYARILAPWVLVVFIGSPLSILLVVLERQRIALLFNIAFIATRIASLVIGGLLASPVLALILFSASGAIIAAVKLWYTLKLAGVNILKSSIAFSRNIALAFIVSSPVMILTFIVKSSDIAILSTSIISILLYYYILFKNDREAYATINNIIKKRRS